MVSLEFGCIFPRGFELLGRVVIAVLTTQGRVTQYVCHVCEFADGRVLIARRALLRGIPRLHKTLTAWALLKQ
jgi:hypothetical protein